MAIKRMTFEEIHSKENNNNNINRNYKAKSSLRW